jgi:hypothetical protein
MAFAGRSGQNEADHIVYLNALAMAELEALG